MQVQEALRVEEYDADAIAAVDASRRVLDAANAVDAPFLPPSTLFRRAMDVRHGWEQAPVRHLLMRVGDEPVAVAEIDLGEWDNRDLAWFRVVVAPSHRRQGYGSRLLAHARETANGLGRTRFGADCLENPAAEPFARRHGFARASQAILRVQSPQELPAGFAEAAYAEAAVHAGDYDLVRVEGRAPDDLVPALAELTAAINDAPTDELDIEDEVFPVERIRLYESATLDSGHRLHRLVARHRVTGELAGHTVVAVDLERPELAHQHDTAVARGHRGHRLGLLLKAGMLGWLAEDEPQVDSIATWNAESNHHMIAVNERLGYRAVGRALEFQTRD